MTSWSAAMVADLRPALSSVAEPDRASQMAAYMKGQFPFLGVASKPRDAVLRQLLGRHGRPDRADALVLAETCWREPEREFQYVGSRLLRREVKKLESVDLDRVRGLIESKSWWDTVDELAAHVVGGLVAADRKLVVEMDRWVADDNLWVARTALLHQLRYKEQTDRERLFSYCELRAADTDFFIRKAIGWALRQYARVEPDSVREYVAAHDHQLSGLSKREATKHL